MYQPNCHPDHKMAAWPSAATPHPSTSRATSWSSPCAGAPCAPRAAAGEPFAGRPALPGGLLSSGGPRGCGLPRAGRGGRHRAGTSSSSSSRRTGTPERDPRSGLAVTTAWLALGAGLPRVVWWSDAGDRGGYGGCLVADATWGPSRGGLASRPRADPADGVERARATLEDTGYAAALWETFTVADLHAVYEAVWGWSSTGPTSTAR